MWDRLPMTIGFLASFSAIVEERVPGVGHQIVIPLVCLGVFSVFLWHLTDDLTLYAWVQFAPLLAIPFITAAFPGIRYTHSWCIFVVLTLYAVAKVVEGKDREIFQNTGGVVSGHTLKHLVASAGPALLVYMLSVRQYLKE